MAHMQPDMPPEPSAFHICRDAAPLGEGRDGQVFSVRDDTTGKVFAA
jgi:hypothetical protein